MIATLLKKLSHLKKARQPLKIKPELATLVDAPPQGDGWLHEIKFDGYRICAVIKNKKVKLFTRNGKDWSAKFPDLVKALQRLPVKAAILDGELVAVDNKGGSSFQLLQNNLLTKKTARLNYYVFDLPFALGFDLSATPLIERKALLLAIFKAWKKKSKRVIYTQYVIGHGNLAYKQAAKHKLEGIIAKKIDSPYLFARTRDWLKIKCVHREELVIVGFTAPKGSRSYFGSLLLGYYNSKKQLIYCGRVGTGFDTQLLAMLYKRLKKLMVPHSVLEVVPKLKNVTWVKPKIVAEVQFTEWTSEGLLRHTAFQGLREDKKAQDVVKNNDR